MTPLRCFALFCVAEVLAVGCRSASPRPDPAANRSPASPASPTLPGARWADVAAETPEPPGNDDAATPPAEPVELSTDRILGACVEAELWSGTLEDVLIEPDGGRVVGFVVAAGDPPALRLLDPTALAWRPAREVFEAAASVDRRGGFEEHFDGREREVLEGRITATEGYPDAARATVLQLHDDRNLHHRVLVELPDFVAGEIGPFEPGASLSVEAVPTRDAQGKLWIASALRAQDRSLRLRAEDGALLLAEFVERAPTLRRLLGTPVRSADERELAVVGFVLELGTARCVAVLVEHEGSRHAIPTEAVALVDDRLVTELDSAAIAGLPIRPLEPEPQTP